MSFWDVVWFIVIAFVFTAYLMMLFSIIADIFRDSETSGVTKALWLIGLIFVPLFVALIYVIVHGNDMARRTATSHFAAQQQQEEYIKQVAGKASPTDQIAQASAMLDKGTISQSEFDTLKAKALAV
jgi:RsiW-degrading membrane proteinase PrsW (M82 family)